LEEFHSPSSLDLFQAAKDRIYLVGIGSDEPWIDPLYTQTSRIGSNEPWIDPLYTQTSRIGSKDPWIDPFCGLQQLAS